MSAIPNITLENEREGKAKAKIRKRLKGVFKKMACKNVKHAIHGTAASAALIVAVLPIGLDAWALRLAEIYMLLSIYSHYGINLTESAAESLLTAAFAQAVGEAGAFAALEAADMAAALTVGTSYAICFGVAVGLIEAVGWATVKKLEGSDTAKVIIRGMETVGAVADASRLVNAIGTTLVNSIPTESKPTGGRAISFCGTCAGRTEDQWLKQASQWADDHESGSVNYSSNVKSCLTNAAKAKLGSDAPQAEIAAYVQPIYNSIIDS